MALTSDGWSTSVKKGFGFVCTTASFIDQDWIIRKFVLDFSALSGSHTGEAFCNLWFRVLHNWNLARSRLSGVGEFWHLSWAREC